MGTIWQNAPAIALESGCFDGLTPVSELRKHGDLGIGAFHELHGEMTGVDGVFYRVSADASAHAAGDDETLPFCMVTNFEPTESFELPAGISESSLETFMDEAIGTRNLFYSMRVDGVFTNLRTRCFPKQSRPYPTLKTVMETQPEFSYERLEGTMVGFRAPLYDGHMTPPGFHLHLVSADRKIGGHVMTFEGTEGTIAAQLIDHHTILYPTTGDFVAKNLD